VLAKKMQKNIDPTPVFTKIIFDENRVDRVPFFLKLGMRLTPI
jgi:hypothetical protein